MNTKAFIILLFLLVVSLPADAQCAMCRAVLETQDGGQAAKGINNGIVYLMIFPYLLIGGIGYAIYRTRKNAKKAQH
ncbi:MAG: hypothetical protein CMC07_06175 [Flavobacteriaceae bacterium]|jgi:hypothetical protein|nr:hypothetical protein [Flavobacteriaceae bacterium]|tara:strand:+ start:32010 stop:32240 length:231 start_codon:yes stop_codon:yes gene_type:complete